MRLLVPAEGPTLEQILDETYPKWGEGLARDAYGRYNLAQRLTPWGRGHLHRLALVEGRQCLSSAKRYDLRVSVDGTSAPAIGIGAVFTPTRLRRHGFASDLLRRMIEEASVEGFRYALLFSEIEPGFYERLGFRTVPLRQFVLEVTPLRGAPGIAIRSGEPRDLPAIVEMNRLQTGSFRLSLDRSAEYAAFALAKKRLLAGFSTPGHRRAEFFVVEEGGRAAAYLVLFQVNETWMITECGDRDPSGARVGAILQSLLARGDDPPRRIRAWLPPGFLPRQWEITTREIPALAMMIRPVGPETMPKLGLGDVAWWHADAF